MRAIKIVKYIIISIWVFMCLILLLFSANMFNFTLSIFICVVISYLINYSIDYFFKLNTGNNDKRTITRNKKD